MSSQPGAKKPMAGGLGGSPLTTAITSRPVWWGQVIRIAPRITRTFFGTRHEQGKRTLKGTLAGEESRRFTREYRVFDPEPRGSYPGTSAKFTRWPSSPPLRGFSFPARPAPQVDRP